MLLRAGECGERIDGNTIFLDGDSDHMHGRSEDDLRCTERYEMSSGMVGDGWRERERDLNRRARHSHGYWQGTFLRLEFPPGTFDFSITSTFT